MNHDSFIKDTGVPSIRPIQELLTELRDHAQECRDWEVGKDFSHERDFEEEFPGLLDAIDSACLVLETITRHEHGSDYNTAIAEAVRVLRIKDCTINHA